MTAPVKIDVCVCTFRRPQLAETLRSLGAQRVPPGVAVRIVVADNDHVPSARRVVDALRADLPFELTYVHCPAANISVARNACLDAGEGDFLAFIDDDCIASAGWLAALLAAAEESGADAVLGPVRAIYADAAPGWMRRGDFHSTNPVRVRGEVLTGYTCNVLMRRVVLLDTEDLPENANTMLESVMMKAETSAIQYDESIIGTDKDRTRIIPHLNISDEEGVAMKSLMHVRYLANFEARARAYATTRWRLYQYSSQVTQAGSVGSEIRSLAAEIDRGVGARFIFRQSNDTDTLHRYSQLGLSDHLVSQLPSFDPGQAVLFVKDRPPVTFQHVRLRREIPLTESNFSRLRLSATQPIYEMPNYRQKRDRLAELQMRKAAMLAD